MNKTEWLRQWRTNRSRTLPILTFPAVQMLGISVRDLVTTPGLQAKAMKVIADTWPMAASLSMMDLSVEAEAFGSPIRYFDMDIPTVVGAIAKTPEQVRKLEIPTVAGHRTAGYVEGILQAKEIIRDRPVFAGVIGPFSLAGRLMDMTEIMVNCYEDPQTVHLLLEKTTKFITEYILGFQNAGADGIIMAEPAAGLLSPGLCEEFSSVYVKRIIEAVRNENFVFIYHNCGNTLPLAESLIGIDADAYHFGNAVDMETMLKKFPKEKVLLGNLSPSDVFRKGDPESVRKATLDLLKRGHAYPNFILSSGCDIPPMTPLDNLAAYFAAIDSFFHHN